MKTNKLLVLAIFASITITGCTKSSTPLDSSSTSTGSISSISSITYKKLVIDRSNVNNISELTRNGITVESDHFTLTNKGNLSSTSINNISKIIVTNQGKNKYYNLFSDDTLKNLYDSTNTFEGDNMITTYTFASSINSFYFSNTSGVDSSIKSIEILYEGEEISYSSDSSSSNTSSTSSTSDSSSDSSSSSSTSDSSDTSSTIDETIKVRTITINRSNVQGITELTLNNIELIKDYPSSFTFNSVSGSLSSDKITKISKIVVTNYNEYKNLKLYTNSSKATEITSTDAEVNTKLISTYTFATPSDSFFFINSSADYRAHVDSIEITYEGKEIEIKENSGGGSGGDSGSDIPITPEDGSHPNLVDDMYKYDADAWSNTEYGDYYKQIDFTKGGNALLGELRALNKVKRTKTPGYGGLWSYYNKTDYDPNNPSKYIGFYSGTSASRGEMNKEHVWPKSHGGNLVDDDIHMTRPTITNENSSRGNSFFVEGMNSTTSGWDPANCGVEKYRGIAARIIFYCVVASDQLSLVDINYSPTSNENRDNKMGKLSDLLKWNYEYPVDESELRRNTGAQSVQGNRNPFIDNPSLATAIFGSYNATTQSICNSRTFGSSKSKLGRYIPQTSSSYLDTSYLQEKEKESLYM